MKKKYSSIFIIFFLLCLVSCNNKECKHQWNDWSIDVEATCSSQGVEQRECLECGTKETRKINITGHNYDVNNLVWKWNDYESAEVTMYCLNDNSHSKTVEATIQEEITLVPSCTTGGVKTFTATVNINGTVYSTTKTKVISPLGHTEVIDEAVDATCTKEGLTQGSHCSVCKEVLIKQTVVEKVNHKEVKIDAVPATCEKQV